MTERDSPLVEVHRGSPTEEELAALLAVVGEAYREEAAETTDAPARPSRWQISARGLRPPLQRERGWNGFSG